jgi:membrane-associated phospholipid phosphatase
MGADQHWATDVLAAGAAGAAVGLAEPPLVLRRRGEKRRGRIAAVAPAPGGLAVVF